jgi:type I restriction enzyme S subunit
MSSQELASNNNQVPEGYKKTEVGVIPEDWKVTVFGKIASFQGGYAFSSRKFCESGRYQIVKMSNLYAGELNLARSSSFIDEIDEIEKAYLLKNEDILISLTGTVGKNDFGYTCRITNQNNLLLNQRVARIIVNQNSVSTLIELETKLSRFRKQFFDKAKGGTGNQTNVSTSDIAQILIPLPPTIEEQRAIAQTLSDVDILIAALDKLIAKKRNIKTATMQQLLTGKTRLPGFGGEWENIQLKQIIDEFIVPMRDKPKNLKGDIPWCRIEDFDGKYLSGSKSGQAVNETTVKSMNLKINPINTLLVSCSANLGTCAIVKRPLVTNQTFIGLVSNSTKINEEFLYYYMTFHARILNDLSSGTTISYLSRQEFEDLLIFIPIKLTEQKAIAQVLSDIDTEITALEKRRAKTQAIKQGMMQELLTGRTRIIDN